MSTPKGPFTPLELPPDALHALASGSSDAKTRALLRTTRRTRNLLLLRGLYDRARTTAAAGATDRGTLSLWEPGPGHRAVGERAPDGEVPGFLEPGPGHREPGERGSGDEAPGFLETRLGHRDPGEHGPDGGALGLPKAGPEHREPGERGPSGEVLGFLNAGLALLGEVQVRAPEVFAEVMGAPMTGAWLGCWARDGALSDAAAHAAPLAAAAALRAGLPFRITVPVRSGALVLPGLGLALPPGAADTAEVTDKGPPGEWYGLPQVRCEAEGRVWSFGLDTLDPFRGGHRPLPPRVLDPAEAARWEAELRGAWRLLAVRHPARAEEVGDVLRSVTPFGPEGPEADGRGGWLSATLGDAVGHVALAPHPGARALAAGLVHEAQHSKLGAVLDLVPLLDVPPGTRCRSPWRDDPRPVSGLLQGAYAFLAVTEFWADEASPDRFARCRAQVSAALTTLTTSPWPTPQGLAFLGTLRAKLNSLSPGR